ncbi:MAG: hypothetical protein KTR30_19040 [Saprospiraceae bacterium]|nr:hypothetical protein [Saprospiraceae bacterium]
MKRQSLSKFSLLLLVVGLLSFTLLPNQPPLKYKKVKGIKITKVAHNKIKKHKQVPACIQLTKDGKITATAGYKLMVSTDKQYFAVIPETQDQPSTGFSKGIEGKKIDGIGILWCHCGGGAGDNCGFEDKQDKGGYTRLACEGSCKCGMEITQKGPPGGGGEEIIDKIYY